jgi:predicted MPP superfamily phosphohydrolase
MKKIILIIFLLGVLIFGYYVVFFEPNNIQIERQVVALKNLPQSFDGIKIVHLSDFHSWRFGSREKRVLKILEEINPDFIFITGDFVDPVAKAITDRDLNSVKIFWQRLGEKYRNRIFTVLGNHDTEIIKKYLKESGIFVLDNESKKLFFGNNFIHLIGVDDPWTGRDDLARAMDPVRNRISNGVEGVEKNKLKILLAHAAEIIDQAIEERMDLVLVGHTHGGQVNIPFLGELIQPLSEYGQKYTSGLFKIDPTPLDNKHLTGYTYLYVNRGIGTSFWPIRFNCPPEITLIELQKINKK